MSDPQVPPPASAAAAAGEPRPIRFVHRGRTVELDPRTPATRSVLDWLRDDCGLTGTKEGCNEGDCGACTVVLGDVAADGTLALQPVNACIQFVPTLDGRALFTVEDVGTPAALHPVQQAMVACHGSQCGFCTPGIVMSLWATYERHRAAGTRPTRQQLADDLSGNLCRCTGYRPILDAGEQMFSIAPAAGFDPQPVLAALRAMAGDGAAAHPGFHAPRTEDELAALLEAQPGARILAGSTDIGLWVNKQFRALPDLVFVGAVASLKRIETRDDGTLVIGAGASLESAWSALAARHPALRDVYLRFASRPVREAGTMGGNVANGSPIGDSAPVLMALDATLVLRRGDRVRRVPLDGFYTGYMQNQLEPGEFLAAIEIPPAPPATAMRAYKISKRFDCDISAVCAGLALTWADDGETIAAARLAFGGMAATVARARGAEAALVGQRWTEAALRTAQAALASDFAPMTDLRASAGYRLQVTQNLLERLWLETRPGQPLPESAVSVFARPGALPEEAPR